MPVSKKDYRALCTLFASIEDEKDADKLLQDILTPQEIDSLAERWQLIQALAKGIPQRTVAKDLKLSISKITRGSRMLQYGTGGFRLFLEKLGKDTKKVG
jgi:TrpR family trp operon transcriptional repressor